MRIGKSGKADRDIRSRFVFVLCVGE